MKDSVRLSIGEEKEGSPYLVVECLPGRRSIGERALLRLSRGSAGDTQAQLIEGVEYRYHLENIPGGRIEFEKSEFFDPDTRDGHRGRLRTGQYTGLVSSEISLEGKSLGVVTFEVESIRLNYRSDYRHMLRDLAEEMSELVMQRFGPSEQTFALDPSTDARTLYQRFAFLKSRLFSEGFQSSLERVTRHPVRTWKDRKELRKPGHGAKAGSNIAREFSDPGPRTKWRHGPEHVPATAPRKFETRQSIESVDNTPNRFVQYCLTHWRHVVATIRDRLEDEAPTAPVKRGLSETNSVIDRLDQLLSRPVFRDVKPMQRFPASNETLQKRPGYRDILEAYIEFEVASNLSWEGGRDTFGAGQRDVATLYEYWIFLEFARIISSLCDEPFDFTRLLEVNKSELNIRLKKGRTQVLRGSTIRNGTEVNLQLWFNRSFGRSVESPGTWTKRMRPDISLKLEADDSPSVGAPIWLHFDAKYRVDGLDDFLSAAPKSGGADSARGQDTSAKRSDLLKMHAYRDAIRKSAGAYVVYPGIRTDGDRFEHYKEFHELLPGLGAFPLRPTDRGDADGTGEIVEFFTETIEHLTTPTTDHERGRYWADEAFSPVSRETAPTPAQYLDSRPAADTTLVAVQYPSRRQYLDVVRRGELCIPLDSRGGFDRRVVMADLAVVAGPENGDVEFGEIEAPASFDSQNNGPSLSLRFELLENAPWADLGDLTADDIFFLKSRLAPEDPIKSPLILSVQELLSVKK